MDHHRCLGKPSKEGRALIWALKDELEFPEKKKPKGLSAEGAACEGLGGGERFGGNANCSAGVNSRGKSLLWLDPCLHFIPGYPRCLLSLLSEELSKLSSKAASLAVTQCVPLYLAGLEITLLKHSQHTDGTEETLSASVCLCWGGEGAEAERAGSDSFRRGQDMTPDPRVPGQTWGHTHTPEVASPWAPEGTAT